MAARPRRRAWAERTQAVGNIVCPGRRLCRYHSADRNLFRLGGLRVRSALLAQARIVSPLVRRRDRRSVGTLSDLRAYVPDLAAARSVRRLHRFLRGASLENLEALLHGFTIALSGNHIFLMVIGVLLGILVGVLPGLGAPNGVSLLLPLTFGMQPVSAIILLSSMYWGALFGGSVTSILFNIPGEPSSVATTFDGYPMARDGRPATALATAFGSAAFGALAGVVLITLSASWVAQVALAFGPPEYFAVYFLAFASFVGMGGSPPIKTLVSLAIGFALAAVGIDTVSGSVRLTMGIDELVKGISFVVAVMGLFGIGELMIAVEDEFHVKANSPKVEWREVFRTLIGLPRYGWVLLRSAAIGCWMGITPGGPTAG